MRVLIVILAALIAGVILGAGSAMVRTVSGLPAAGQSAAGPAIPVDLPPGEGFPKVAVDKEEYKFGQMDSGAEGTHDFLFTNTGTAPLQLTVGATSCRCAVAEIDRGNIPPGKSGKVKLKWKAKELIGPYRQTAKIETNDPGRPEVTLTVEGEITVAVQNDPAELVFNGLSPRDAPSGEVRLWCRLPGPAIEILDFKLSDQDIAKYFQVAYEPLKVEESQTKQGVKSGVRVRVAIKPGLPRGQFQQTILIRTNLESYPAVTIPIQGSIGRDIVITGPDWDTALDLLDIGTVSSQVGAERQLMLTVHGPLCKEVKFKPVLVTPDFLQMKLGETVVKANGTFSQTPLTIQIPKGSRPVNHLGSEVGKYGRIQLETSHPRMPQLRIYVRFAVEGG